MDSNLTTLIRTFVILGGLVYFAGRWPQSLQPAIAHVAVARAFKTGAGRFVGLCFRALIVGVASKVAPVGQFTLLLEVLSAVRAWVGITRVGAGVLVLAFKR